MSWKRSRHSAATKRHNTGVLDKKHKNKVQRAVSYEGQLFFTEENFRVCQKIIPVICTSTLRTCTGIAKKFQKISIVRKKENKRE